MKHYLTFAAVLMFSFSGFAQTPENYPPNPDAQEQTGVPKGELMKFTFENSKIFPGTWREYWVYVPAQYNPQKPACVYVNQDGVLWNAPTVFDNLIHKQEMPVTIGVFVMHGRVKAANPDAALDRFNRSFEYDGLGDNYARFILEELLPEIKTKKTTDGRAIQLSKNGNDRAIGGISSGAVCAFTAAWERPAAFSRVFSAIGTFVDLRGGGQYAALVRKYEPKPLRIFLQDGANDLNIYGGDWWMANQTLERALTWAGYEVQHVWGEGGHNSKHSAAIFADAMRYLWKGWPAPVKTGASKNQMLNDILVENEGWQLVGEGPKFSKRPTANAKGEVFFDDSRSGKMYAAAKGFAGNDVVVAHNGNMYVTNPFPNTLEPSKIWFIKPNGEKKSVQTNLKYANGIALSPDQTLLYVTDLRSHWVHSYQIQADGSLAHGQKFCWLHTPDTADDSNADGIKTDRDGRIYVATRLGIQVCDQLGRVNVIIPVPNGCVSNLCFGGPNFDEFYATCGDKVYKRRLKARGVNGWDKPNKPNAPKL